MSQRQNKPPWRKSNFVLKTVIVLIVIFLTLSLIDNYISHGRFEIHYLHAPLFMKSHEHEGVVQDPKGIIPNNNSDKFIVRILNPHGKKANAYFAKGTNINRINEGDTVVFRHYFFRPRLREGHFEIRPK